MKETRCKIILIIPKILFKLNKKLKNLFIALSTIVMYKINFLNMNPLSFMKNNTLINTNQILYANVKCQRTEDGLENTNICHINIKFKTPRLFSGTKKNVWIF